MIQEIVQADCGILFDLRAFDRWKLPHELARPPPSRESSFQGSSGSGESSVGLSGQQSLASMRSFDSSSRDAKDVEVKIRDELKRAPAWKLLEIVPTRFPFLKKKKNGNLKWVKKIR
jgi:hypothetical protein